MIDNICSGMGLISLKSYVVYVVWRSCACPDVDWPKLPFCLAAMADLGGVPNPFKVFVGQLFGSTRRQVLELVAVGLGAPKPDGGCYVVMCRDFANGGIASIQAFCKHEKVFCEYNQTFCKHKQVFCKCTSLLHI